MTFDEFYILFDDFLEKSPNEQLDIIANSN